VWSLGFKKKRVLAPREKALPPGGPWYGVVSTSRLGAYLVQVRFSAGTLALARVGGRGIFNDLLIMQAIETTPLGDFFPLSGGPLIKKSFGPILQPQALTAPGELGLYLPLSSRCQGLPGSFRSEATMLLATSLNKAKRPCVLKDRQDSKAGSGLFVKKWNGGKE